mmetsp:Transcript_45040/g.146466  ORF Transcript_45040/g.146466 Transcript_45040/m.146466 type:complete len:264 (-) Transcript_45040:66-857(-)
MADGLIPAKIDKFFEDLSVTLSRQLYGALQNAVKDDDTLAEMLADEDADHYDDIKKGIAAIKSLIEHGRAARRRGPGHARQDEAHPAQGAQDSRARRVRGGQGRVRREPQELRRLLHQAAPAQGVRVVPQGDHERHRLGRHRGETPTSPSSNVVDNRQYGRSWSSPSHLYVRPPPLRRLRNCARDSRRCRSRLASSDPQPRYPMRGWGAVEDQRPRSRLVDGHTHTHSVLTTQGLHLRSFVPLRRGFAKTVLQRRGFALHPQP